MDLFERMRRTDLDNWVHFDARELERGELPWGRNYMARAVAEARLNSQRSDEVTTGAQWEWEVSREDRDFARMMEEIERELQVEYDAFRNTYSVTRRSECKQNQSLDTAKLDAFIDEM